MKILSFYRSYKILVFLIFFCFSLTIKAQKQQDLKAQLSGIPFGNYGLAYEAILKESFSIGTAINFTNRVPSLDTYNKGMNKDSNFTSLSVSPEVRYYTNPNYYSDGVFWGAYLRYLNHSLENNNVFIDNETSNIENEQEIKADYKTSKLFLGISCGKKFLLDSGFFYEISSGVGFAILNNINYENSESENYWEDVNNPAEFLDVRFSISIGWRLNMKDKF